ncbi:MAG: formylglycine-generating enzyme family protein [Bacteroidota bacterium]|nr:formylglycine-generating enzyme family protein [Bacteroidota bacterium]
MQSILHMIRIAFVYIPFLLLSCTGEEKLSGNSILHDITTEQVTIVTHCTNLEQSEMANISGGKYFPLYGKDSTLVAVDSFIMDVYPVTNMEYKQFVNAMPQWKKSTVKFIFADDHYLSAWTDDTTFFPALAADAPVTTVSWFAARAYCDCVGKRLPSLDEWEYVAMADETHADARTLDAYNQFILAQYERPQSYAESVGQRNKNYWGLYDLHGLVWEWTEDFSSVMISGESRKDGSNDPDLFCGSGSLGTSDLMNYAAFMRYAFRGSLEANYNIRNLGFRCAKNISHDQPEL